MRLRGNLIWVEKWFGFELIDFGFSTFEAMCWVKFGFSRPGFGFGRVGKLELGVDESRFFN